MSLPAGKSLAKIVFRGTLNTSSETFAHQMHAVSTAPDLSTVSIAANAWLSNFILTGGITGISGITDLAHCFRTVVKWTQLYVVFVNPSTGVDQTPGLVTAINQQGANATSSIGCLPYQVSHCITLIDGAPGVKTNRNRFYLPPYCTALLALSDTSRLPATIPSTIATAINNGNVAAKGVDPSWQLAVYSPHLHDGGVVTQTYIGDVLDTQRRRRRSLGEVRLVSAVT
jgi:hypothetical protein